MPLRDDPALRRAIFEHARDAMLLVDPAGRVLDANAAALALLGRERGDVVGREVGSFGLDDAGDELARAIAERRPVTRDVGLVRDGLPRIAEVVLTPDIVPGAHLLAMRDRTEQRAREAESDRYRVIWQRARDIAFFVDGDGRIVDANDAAVRTYGYPRDVLVGMPVTALRAPETLHTVPEQLRAAFADGALFETVHVRSDGRRIPVEVGSRATTIRGETLLLSVVRDLTERNEMHARLAQSDRLASVGMLAAGVAHEINNPLTYVIASLEVAHRIVRDATASAGAGAAPDALARAATLLETALQGTERVRVIVRDLKTLARTDDEESDVDVRAVLDTCVDVAQHEIRRRVRVSRAYAPELPRVRANEARLAQVFLNLIVNAAQAIRASARGEGTIDLVAEPRDGEVVVTVADDGEGVDPAVLTRIFEPFVTTKKASAGTGLGLYVTSSIVRALGGEVAVSSERGRGARFTVTLPAAPPRTPASRPAPPPALPRRSRVLVVDDELAIGESLRASLGGEHDLVVLASAEAAIEWLVRDDAFDVVLTDFVMDGAGGLELIEHLRATRPALAGRVILMSGGALPPDLAQRAPGTPVLEKPFVRDALVAAIARALERASAG